MSKLHDKRIHFIGQCLQRKIVENLEIANNWYISQKDRNKTDNADLLKRFKDWLPAEG
jgi:hypothetical protein